jgi:hypothetical protein
MQDESACVLVSQLCDGRALVFRFYRIMEHVPDWELGRHAVLWFKMPLRLD